MYIVIKINYEIMDSTCLQSASFKVDDLEFVVNPDNEAARIAYIWFNRIWRKQPFTSKINKVLYNEKNDITQLVQQRWDDARRMAFENWKAPWE
ncbi:hypothetical protein [Niallia sp. 03190]|uniref:hypothetical protein n=1 Tax=Niallia sp. 03190 TaxID=3458061 RepID=UPI0040445AE4